MIFSGWAAVFDLVVGTEGVRRAQLIVDLVASYLGVSASAA